MTPSYYANGAPLTISATHVPNGLYDASPLMPALIQYQSGQL